MPGKYGPADCSVTLEDAPAGSAQALTNFILEGISIKKTAIQEQTNALGDAAEEHTPVGVTRTEPITLTCIWDTTATTGTHAVLGTVDDGPQDDGRELIVIFGDSKTYTVDVRLETSEVVAANGVIQKIIAGLLPTGVGVWS